MVLFCESDAPPLPEGTVPVEVVSSDERITYAEWFRWVQRQGSGIGLLLNADMYLDEGLEHLEASFNRPDAFLALTRYNPGHAGFHLNDYPHWTQDVWGVRADAELPESLLYASSFPLGFPGCDNRIAYVMWSHGFHVRNPCYHVRSVHLQASTARSYHKTSDRLYGGVSYVHPSLAPEEDAELEFTLWTRSEQRPAGVLINQQAIERGVHQLRHAEVEVAQRFLDQQQFTGLSWVHEAVGSAHLEGEVHPFASEDTVFLPMTALLGDGVELWLKRPTQLEGITMRLPRRASAGHKLVLQAEGEGEARLELQGDQALNLKPGGERRFWQPAELKGTPWCRLRMKLNGVHGDAEPAWRPEEGAELVLFGEEGALAEAKSVNVIAETAQVEEAAKPLRTIQFADSDFIKLSNLALEPSEITGPDGAAVADVIASADGASEVKYAFNKYTTTETGAYTASIVIKAGTQAMIVLRINDQAGDNDTRQAFDLAKGLKVGPPINGGSATGATSGIESLGDGWYRCSVAAVFVEPLSFLQAPSVWFEHYAPSTSVGTLYTSEACVFEGVYLPSSLALQQKNEDEYKQSLSAIDAAEPAVTAESNAPEEEADRGKFSSISSKQFNSEGCESVKRFGSRFEVFCNGEALFFVDRFWPTVARKAYRGSAQDALALGEEALFAEGFLQPLQEWKPKQIASEKTHKDQLLFWQYPCRTEEDAYFVHKELSGPRLEGDTYQVYVGLPWATFIDRGVNQQLSGDPYPEALLLAHRKRSEALATVLRQWGRKLQVHSVCQHIFWREATARIRSAGVTDLWISHMEKGLDEEQGMWLHSWSLYAVNDRDPARRKGLYYVPIEQRPVFASFNGAHMKHYLSDVRKRMESLSALEGYQVTIKDMWHFNKVVYNFQVYGDESKKDAIATDEVQNYNTLLSHTRFSLCPVGAGPNTLRLWESLAVGAIPVVLSDMHQLPDLERLLPGEGLRWEEVVVLHPEADLEQLDARLQAIGMAERHRRQRLCRRVYEATVAMSCFGRSQREAEPIPLLQELFKPQQVQVPGHTEAAFTGVAIQVPAALALASEGPGSIVVHLDQTEQLLGFRLKRVACKLDALEISLSRYTEYNKFEELPLELVANGDDEAWLWLPQGERCWAMGLKLTAQWRKAEQAQPGAELQLAVLSEKDAFAREARRLDRAGILKAASDRNAERQDDTFDTKHINSGLILERLPEVARPEDVVEGNELFPPLAIPQTNLIGEPLGDGITMYVHLMNRNENVQKNLTNWLQQKFDELILLDWSSSEPVADLPGIFDDPRVRVVRVEGQSKFIRTLAQNLASRMARHSHIFKCDSDVEFKGDFFAAHLLEAGEFWVGDWHHAREENEKHLHGETFYCIEDFERVNGYDERILSYGQDDTNLKDRMALSGLAKKTINNDFLNHQEHGDLERASNQTMLHPMVRTYAHRLFVNSQPFYSKHQPAQAFMAHSADGPLVVFDSIDLSLKTHDHGAGFEDAALNIVAGWYAGNNIFNLSREEKIKIIWEHSETDKSTTDDPRHLGSEVMTTKPSAARIPAKADLDKTKAPKEVSAIAANTASLFSSKQRILILGSSVSIQKNGYLPILRQKLDEICIDSHEFLNASLGGTPSEATYCYVRSNIVYDIAAFKPTICILEKTPNDKIFDYNKITPKQQAEKLARIENYLYSLIKHLTDSNCIVIIVSMFTLPDICLTWAQGDPLNYLSPLYDKIASKANYTHINIAETIYNSFTEEELKTFFLDEVHLTAEGSELVASLALSRLISIRPIDCDVHLQTHKLHPSDSSRTKIFPLLEGKEASFQNSLLEVMFDTIKFGQSRTLTVENPGSLVGLFYLNDPHSGWIKISTDIGPSIELRLFDLFSYMPRLHYRSLPEIRFDHSVTIEVIDNAIDYASTLDSYENSKTFDPNAPWAIQKYREPLINAMTNQFKACFKPVLLMASLNV